MAISAESCLYLGSCLNATSKPAITVHCRQPFTPMPFQTAAIQTAPAWHCPILTAWSLTRPHPLGARTLSTTRWAAALLQQLIHCIFRLCSRRGSSSIGAHAGVQRHTAQQSCAGPQQVFKLLCIPADRIRLCGQQHRPAVFVPECRLQLLQDVQVSNPPFQSEVEAQLWDLSHSAIHCPMMLLQPFLTVIVILVPAALQDLRALQWPDQCQSEWSHYCVVRSF